MSLLNLFSSVFLALTLGMVCILAVAVLLAARRLKNLIQRRTRF
jgi:hypothetical protein